MSFHPIKDPILIFNRYCLRLANRTGWRVFHRIPNYILFLSVHRRFPDRRRANIRDMGFFNKVDEASIALGPFVDKELVKHYVRGFAPEIRVAETFAVLRSEEDLRGLTEDRAYVAKPTHTFGVVVFKPEGGKLTEEEVSKLSRSLRENLYLDGGEIQYRHLEPKIIVEEFIGDPPTVPSDFKGHCHRGRFLTCTLVQGRHTSDPRRARLDRTGNRVNATVRSPWIETGVKRVGQDFELPAAYPRLIEMAEKLAAPFRYVRVDLYLVGDEVFFGELTFSPGNCLFAIIPRELEEAEAWP